jgi:uncharacterized protein YqgV (UPF0045/DUF77 family)
MSSNPGLIIKGPPTLPRVAHIRVEFTVEPFREGSAPGAHVQAALDCLRQAGLPPDVGPFGSAVEGDAAAVMESLAAAAMASFAAGATGITMAARAVATGAEADRFLAAVRPVARALGGRVVTPDVMSDDAVPLVWAGQVVGAVEKPEAANLRNGLAMLVSQIEGELGGRLADLSRVDKQRAVRMLDERGAFAIRNAVDEVADAMGVSRVTVYNYLNATRAV